MKSLRMEALNDLRETISLALPKKTRENKPKIVDLTKSECLCNLWTECESECDDCIKKFTPAPKGALTVKASLIHGWGLFANAVLTNGGTVILECQGKRLSEKEMKTIEDNSCVAKVAQNECIDAGKGKQPCKHVNHSCFPNCSLQKFIDSKGETQLAIVQEKERVPIGEELTADCGSLHALRLACNCGHTNCTGSAKHSRTEVNVLVIRMTPLHTLKDGTTLSEVECTALASDIPVSCDRDTARCIAIEETCKATVFAVSDKDPRLMLSK